MNIAEIEELEALLLLSLGKARTSTSYYEALEDAHTAREMLSNRMDTHFPEVFALAKWALSAKEKINSHLISERDVPYEEWSQFLADFPGGAE